MVYYARVLTIANILHLSFSVVTRTSVERSLRGALIMNLCHDEQAVQQSSGSTAVPSLAVLTDTHESLRRGRENCDNRDDSPAEKYPITTRK